MPSVMVIYLQIQNTAVHPGMPRAALLGVASYTDFVWENFGPLEWLLCIEIVILLAAAFFYQVAKFIAKQDRHDPLVRFYRVFWQTFTMPVTPFKELELAGAEAAARSFGMQFAGDVDSRQLTSMDAVDLGEVAEGGAMPGIARPEYARDEESERHAPVKGGKAPARGEQADTSKQTGTFDVRIVPGSEHNRLMGIQGGEIVVEVTADAEDGQANGTIVNLLSARSGIPAYQISLIKGHYKIRKTFLVGNMDQDKLNRRLNQALNG